MPSRKGYETCPFCRQRVAESASRCPHCQGVLPDFDDADPPPRRLRRGAPIDDDPPPRRLRRPPVDDFDEPRPLRRRQPDDYDEPPPRRRRPRYDDEDNDEYEEDDRPRRRRGEYANCPHCGCRGHADKVTFTWWGGLIGPAMLSHVTCRKCHRGYNGKSGKDNTVGIVIYTGVGIVLGLVVFALVFMARVR